MEIYQQPALYFGDGSLVADFDNAEVDLNLDLNSINEDDFVDITIENLKIGGNSSDEGLNHFYIDASSTGTFDYDATNYADYIDHDLTGINVEGSFFGPNAEEVAGGICFICASSQGDIHDDPNNGQTDNFNIVFIGKKQ